MKYLLIAATLLLSACGADGRPEAPKPGLSLTGEARAGIIGTM